MCGGRIGRGRKGHHFSAERRSTYSAPPPLSPPPRLLYSREARLLSAPFADHAGAVQVADGDDGRVDAARLAIHLHRNGARRGDDGLLALAQAGAVASRV